MNQQGFMGKFSYLSLLAAGLVAVAGCVAGAEREPPVDPRGTTWRLLRLHGKAVPVDATQRPPYIVLQSDGRASGNLGCNATGAGFSLEGPHLGFGPLRSTRMACQKGMEIEQDLATALGLTAAWRVDNGHLILLDGANKPLAEFVSSSPL